MPSNLPPPSAIEGPVPIEKQVSNTPAGKPDYGFILDPSKPSKTGLFQTTSRIPRGLLMVIGAVLLLAVLLVLKSALSSNDLSLPSIVSVVQQQEELITLTTSGTQNAQSVAVKNFSETCLVSLQSEQQQLLAYLVANHHKISANQLQQQVSKPVADQLTTAVNNSSFDDTYKSIMQQKLTSYQQAVAQAALNTKGPKGQSLLRSDSEAVQLLLQQLGH